MPQGETFYRACSLVLFISQLYALLPVCNVRSADINQIKFKWLSVRVFYSALIMLLNFGEFIAVLYYISHTGINFHNSSTIALYIVCLLEHVFFWRLAYNWQSIMSHWYHVEQLFLSVPYRFCDEYRMKRRINIVVATVMLSALVEHFLLLSNSLHLSNLERTQCHINVSYLESVYKWERPHLHYILPYSIWFMPLLEWINETIAYPRAFTDCFIMCIGIGLAARFHQLHGRIAAVHHKLMPAVFWTEVREHYLALKRLVRVLDNAIAPLILLAFGNNMSFICFQLFNSFKNIGVDLIVMLAFWYSLIFAVLRTSLTIFVTSSMNDYELKIISLLRDVPAKAWTTEVQRFSEQLGNDITALSGSGFFFITRQLVLAMGTTIITYELMISDVINQATIRQRTVYC
ncbi:gustatory receptor for sugar taste 64b [Drosophila busckii]|uniref:gustatory receptor for sugar taste 64b n=1 Tax=Drosophila busckii TaxID=30019 RepID=UPI00083EBF7E|nr:gustatory receptor for sugar taste 64b [Drosophila busckii]